LENIDSKKQITSDSLVSQGKGFFTVGIVVDKIGVLTSKAGKLFTILKLSDIVKYEMPKVKQFVSKEFEGDEMAQKTALKSYTYDGYKTVSFMAFASAA
jgi:hypothetical protein